MNIFKKPNCIIKFNEVPGRHQHKLTDRNLNSARYPTFFNGDSISGYVELKLNSRTLKHKGIKAELHGVIEKYGTLSSSSQFLFLTREILPVGEIIQEKTLLEFNFRNPNLKYESYKGKYASVKYYIKIIIDSNLITLISSSYEKEFAVVNPNEESILYDNDFPIKLKVGVKNVLRLLIEFEHCNNNCRGVLKGFVTFDLVNANIQFMEVQLVRREVIFDGKSYEPEYIARYELIDGGPIKNERIPIRFFLKTYNLTPSYPDIEGIFGVKYFLNLVVVDDNENRYFKFAEVNLFRLFRDKKTYLENYNNNGLFISKPFYEEEYFLEPNTIENSYINKSNNNYYHNLSNNNYIDDRFIQSGNFKNKKKSFDDEYNNFVLNIPKKGNSNNDNNTKNINNKYNRESNYFDKEKENYFKNLSNKKRNNLNNREYNNFNKKIDNYFENKNLNNIKFDNFNTRGDDNFYNKTDNILNNKRSDNYHNNGRDKNKNSNYLDDSRDNYNFEDDFLNKRINNKKNYNLNCNKENISNYLNRNNFSDISFNNNQNNYNNIDNLFDENIFRNSQSYENIQNITEINNINNDIQLNKFNRFHNNINRKNIFGEEDLKENQDNKTNNNNRINIFGNNDDFNNYKNKRNSNNVNFLRQQYNNKIDINNIDNNYNNKMDNEDNFVIQINNNRDKVNIFGDNEYFNNKQSNISNINNRNIKKNIFGDDEEGFNKNFFNDNNNNKFNNINNKNYSNNNNDIRDNSYIDTYEDSSNIRKFNNINNRNFEQKGNNKIIKDEKYDNIYKYNLNNNLIAKTNINNQQQKLNYMINYNSNQNNNNNYNCIINDNINNNRKKNNVNNYSNSQNNLNRNNFFSEDESNNDIITQENNMNFNSNRNNNLMNRRISHGNNFNNILGNSSLNFNDKKRDIFGSDS